MSIAPLSFNTLPFKHSFLPIIPPLSSPHVPSFSFNPAAPLSSIDTAEEEHASMSTPRERIEDVVGKKIKREADVITDPRTGRRQGLVGGTLNTVTPCAACKLLRRRCAQDCPFSPYFSPHEPHKFASVHRVFGASNVSKMLMEVPEPQRADATNSLVYEANLRLRDPIYGCMGAISALQQQVQALEAELEAVKAEILKHKFRQANAAITTSHADLLAVPSPSSSVSIASLPPLPAAPPAGPASMFTSSSATSYSSINTTSHNVAYFG